jgi:hypothetical protein
MENPKNFEIEEDLRQSKGYGQYMESIGWNVISIQSKSRVKFQIFIRKIGPVGIAKLQRTMGRLPMELIEKKLKENRVMMCKIEPYSLSWVKFGLVKGQGFKNYGYKISTWPLLGTKTLKVNLRPDVESIFSSFKKDCRYVLRKIKIKTLKVKINEFGLFYRIWKISAKRKNLWIPKEKEYQNLVKAFGENIFSITIDDLAGALILLHKKSAFYYYAGSTVEGTRQNLPYLIVWEAMKEAKRRGCMIWDFEGIYDHRWPNKGWLGFSHFKKSFGGEEVEFPGSYEKWRWPF